MDQGNNLGFFFNPGTVAVVGASPTAGKISNIILKSLMTSGFEGRIYPINPKHDSIDGVECLPNLGAVDGDIDLAVFALPADMTPELIKGCGGKLKAAIVISGGFAESGPKGEALEKELKETARREGIRIIGPNCMGIFDTVSKLDTFFVPAERLKRPGRGGLSIISQSGSFAVTSVDELACEGIGVARVISYGNMADVNESDCLEFLASDDETSAVAVYIESVTDGRRFVEAASRCTDKKPVMAIKVGKSRAAANAARSHTGAMAGRYEVYRAAFKKAGIIELEGYEDFISGCKALGSQKPAAGKRVVIITDGGGMGVGIADACVKLGLEVAPLPNDIVEKMESELPTYCSMSNPMDLTASATDELFAEALEKTLSEDDFDIAIVASLWGPPALTDELPELLAAKANLIDKPVIICSPGGEYAKRKNALYRGLGFPVFSSPESAVRAAAVLAGGANTPSTCTGVWGGLSPAVLRGRKGYGG